MSNPSFSFSILNGIVKAATVRRGAVQHTWDQPEPVIDFATLHETLKQAAAKTSPSGKHTAIVLADARLSDHFVELPQARGATLHRLLDRSANRVKAFQGDVAWSSQSAIPSKKGTSALLHLCPQPVLDQLLRACHDANLELVRLLPTTAVLAHHLRSLPVQKDELVLLAAESGRSTTLVVGRKDGRLCLGRILPNTWNGAADRVWTDVARSIGFAEQQSAHTVQSIYLFGEGAESQVETASRVLKLPVKISPVPYSPFYWAEQGAKLPEKDDGNLVSAAIREAPQRQRMMTLTTIFVLLLLLGSALAAGAIEAIRRNEQKGLDEVTRQINKISAEKVELEKSLAELERMRKSADFIESELPPAPEWFLAYLGQVLPPELAVTRLHIVHTNNLWSVHIAGTAESRTNTVDKFDTFCKALETSPFKLTLTDQDLGKTAATNLTEQPPLIQRFPAQVASVLRRESKLPPNTFVINGVMQ